MNKLTRMVVFLVLPALSQLAVAGDTGKISGRVVDQEMGEPLVGVNMLIVGTAMGAATDEQGDYVILQVSPGIYSVSAQYIGYAKVTTQNIRVVTDLTTKLDVTLRPEAIEGEEVTIVAERPLFERSATNEVRVIRGEQIQNMPLRGYNRVAALQTGVVDEDGTLHIRGGRSDETAYYVDGVYMNNPYFLSRAGNVPNLALEEVAMQIGGFGAEYGDANAGIVNVTTKTGGNRLHFTGEAITDGFMSTEPTEESQKPFAYSYGYNLLSGSVGGPVPIAKSIRFYGAFEKLGMLDGIPTNAFFPDLHKSVLNPANGLPDNGEEFTDKNGNTIWDEGESYVDTDGNGKYDAPTYLDSSLVENVSFKYGPKPGNSLDRIAFNGNVLIDLESLIALPWKLKLGGNYYNSDRSTYSHSGALFNYYNDANTKDEIGIGGELLRRSTVSQSRTSSLFARLQGNIPGVSQMFFSLQGSKARDFGKTYDPVFGKGEGRIPFRDGTISDFTVPYVQIGKEEDYADPVWIYQDGDGNEVTRSYWDDDPSLTFEEIRYDTTWVNPLYTGIGNRPVSYVQWANYSTAGYTNISYVKDLAEHTTFKGSLIWQLGDHELKGGFEYRDNTIRYYRMGGASRLTRYFMVNRAYSPTQDRLAWDDSLQALLAGQDGEPDYLQDVRDTWDHDNEEIADVNGDGQIDWDDYFEDFVFQGFKSAYAENFGWGIKGEEEVNSGLDRARKPVMFGFFVQDKYELEDLIMTLGLRFDRIDPQTKRFNPETGGNTNIVINDLGTLAETVYWQDIDGDGEIETHEYIAYEPTEEDAVGLPHRIPTQANEYWSPRIGLAFPVTDRTVFHAQYGKYVQQPELNRLFLSYTRFLSNIEQGNFTVSANPELVPENTTSYEIGFKQLITPDVSVDATVYYKQISNYVQIRRVPARPTGYALYTNGDYGTIKGLSLSLNTRRVQNWQVSANYTLQVAGGTGSNSTRQFTIAWLGGNFPTFVSPLEYDQRQTGNLMLDYRVGDRGNIVTRNFGFNLLFQFGSGLRYTPSRPRSAVFGGQLSYQPIAALNSGTMPWTFNFDMRVDKSFKVGLANLTAYLWIENVLDRRNVDDVFNSTGLPNTDGHLTTPAGETWLNSTSIGGAPFASRLYESRIASPYNYGKPRQVRLGVRVDL